MSANIVVYAGLVIGLVYGAVGLLSGFCLMSSLRGWWAQGDSRLVRSYALALGVATSVLAAAIPARAAARMDPVRALQKGKFQVLSGREGRRRVIFALLNEQFLNLGQARFGFGWKHVASVTPMRLR